jgi:hypothetical protein
MAMKTYKLHFNAMIAHFIMNWQNVKPLNLDDEIVDFYGVNPDGEGVNQIIPSYDTDKAACQGLLRTLIQNGAHLHVYEDIDGLTHAVLSYESIKVEHIHTLATTAIAMCAVDYIFATRKSLAA